MHTSEPNQQTDADALQRLHLVLLRHFQQFERLAQPNFPRNLSSVDVVEECREGCGCDVADHFRVFEAIATLQYELLMEDRAVSRENDFVDLKFSSANDECEVRELWIVTQAAVHPFM